MREPRSLLRTVGSIGSATFLSRILGLVRDQLQAAYFGAGAVTDAYLAAFRIPNLLRDLFAEGALSSAFVPTFTAERVGRGDAAAWRLANRIITLLVLLLSALALVTILFAPSILRVYVAGFTDQAKMSLAVTMTRILAPFLLFVALAAVAMGALNAFGRFFLPALAPASFNVAAIVGILALVPILDSLGYEPGLALALGALIGGVLQFAVQLPALHREGFRFRFDLAPGDPALRRVGRLMLPAVFGLAATQINILVDTAIASWYAGAITWLMIAFRLMQLPIGVFGVALGTANLARVSRDVARGDPGALRANLAAALRVAALLVLPATAGLIALRRPIVALLFEHGLFTAADTTKTAAAVLCYGLGLFAYAVTKTQVPTFYALGDTRTPVIGSALAVTVKIAVTVALVFTLPRFGVDAFLGLALSTSVAAWINFGWLSRGLRRRLGSLKEHRVLSFWLRMLGVSAVIGVAAASTHAVLGRLPGPGGLAGETLRLAAGVGAGLLIFTLAAWSMDVPELRTLRSRLRG